MNIILTDALKFSWCQERMTGVINSFFFPPNIDTPWPNMQPLPPLLGLPNQTKQSAWNIWEPVASLRSGGDLVPWWGRHSGKKSATWGWTSACLLMKSPQRAQRRHWSQGSKVGIFSQLWEVKPNIYRQNCKSKRYAYPYGPTNTIHNSQDTETT